MDNGRRLKRLPNCIFPYTLLRSVIRPVTAYARCSVGLQKPVLEAFCSTIGPSGIEASSKLCVHLVELPQGLSIQVDIDRLQAYRHHVEYANLDRRVSSLRLVGRDGVQRLEERLQGKRC